LRKLGRGLALSLWTIRECAGKISDLRRSPAVSFMTRAGEIVRAIRGARLPPPPKRRYDLVSEAMEQTITGEGGGSGHVRRGGAPGTKGKSSTRR
jgi:hypothetical protein